MTQLSARTGTDAGLPAARRTRAPLRPVASDAPEGPGLPGLLLSCDVDGYCRRASAGRRPWLGLDPAAMVGRHLGDVLGERLHSLGRPCFEAALAGHERLLETMLHDRLGRELHVEVTWVPERTPDGDVHGVLVHARDVTDRVREVTGLAQAQQLSGVGSWSWERDLGFAASAQAVRLLGHDPASWQASPEAAAAGVHPDDLPSLTERLRDTLAHGGGWEARHRVVRADDEVRHVESRVRVELGTDGLPLRVWGTAHDVTEQVRRQRETEAHVQRLGDTMAMLGHDVRQPLTAVLGFLDEAGQVLRTGDADEATTRNLLRACIDKGGRAGRRMRRLVDDILAVASVDAGTLVARPERVRVADLVAEVAEEVRLEVAVSGAEGVRVRADLFHLRQTLANLLVNASRYGRAPFEVVVSVRGSWVDLAVDDHGDGVAEDLVPDIFDRFSRGQGPGHGDRAGAGLGLHLVRSLVEANGGSVRYADAPGGGARFVVTLPKG